MSKVSLEKIEVESDRGFVGQDGGRGGGGRGGEEEAVKEVALEEEEAAVEEAVVEVKEIGRWQEQKEK